MRNEIKKMIKDVAYPEVIDALHVYAEEGRPFALPTFKRQDRSSNEQRLGNLLGGFPFTNERYPWPIGGMDALHMQPIAQIDLRQASLLLGFDFGEGLLQIWGMVGKSKESLNVVSTAFDDDYKKGVLMRVVPMLELGSAPSSFFPDFAPWLTVSSVDSVAQAVLFIEPNEAMLLGSVMNWRLSKELMYPKPRFEDHTIENLVPESIGKSKDVDSYELFIELRAAIDVHLKCPGINNGLYLGGVSGCGDDRARDPALGFPLLFNLGGEVNLSVIFDNEKFVKPVYANDEKARHVHFPRESRLKVVYFYNG